MSNELQVDNVPYVYVLVRKDLTAAQICVQSGHACIESAKHNPYADEHPHLVVCGVDNETKLENCALRLEREGIRCFRFYEPDIGNQLTAVSTGIVSGQDRERFKRFQLLKL